MRPYSQLAPYFGAIFPCTDEHRRCFKRELPDPAGKAVLDVGYGTGEQLAWFAEQGAEIYGAEVEQALVDWARERFAAPPERFRLCGMESLSTCFNGMRFDLALLLGNTLAHAGSLDEAAHALHELAKVLAPRGKAVLSVVNYDRILGNNITTLPDIESKTRDGRPFRFVRTYDLAEAPESILFRTRLETPEGTVEGAHKLLPIRRGELEEIARASFAEVAIYGGYLGEEWTPDCFSAVVVAKRPFPAT